MPFPLPDERDSGQDDGWGSARGELPSRCPPVPDAGAGEGDESVEAMKAAEAEPAAGDGRAGRDSFRWRRSLVLLVVLALTAIAATAFYFLPLDRLPLDRFW